MALYKKKLSSIDELKREQLKLKYKKLESSKESFLPVREIKRSSENTGKNFFSFVSDLVTSNSPINTVLTIAGPVLKLIRGRKKKPSKKNFLKSLVFDLLFGYLKWKAIKIAYVGLSRLVETNKAEKAQKRIR